nr:IS110-like element IS110 family transposase [Kitasatospora purpeofusca]
MIDTGDIDVFLGLDVGKGEHHATAVTPAGKRVLDKRLPNTEPKLRELFAKLQAKHGTVLVVVDRPASIGALPLAVARAMGCPVAHLPGLTMRRIADLCPGEAKTDAKDAFIIADAARAMPHTLRAIDGEDETIAEPEMIVGSDDDPAGEATRVANRLHGLLTRIHPSLERALGPRLQHPAVQTLLERFGSPAQIRKAGRRRLVTLLRPKAPRTAERPVEESPAAPDQQTVTVPGTETAALIVPSLAGSPAAVLDQRKLPAARIEEPLEAHPHSKVLTSMPGVGVRTGARILIEVGDASTFPTAGHLAACAGLAPATRSPGSSIRGEQPSRRGNKQLERAFFLPAFAALRDPAPRAHYNKKTARGKHHTQAQLRLARHRADVLFTMLRDRTYYEPEPAAARRGVQTSRSILRPKPLTSSLKPLVKVRRERLRKRLVERSSDPMDRSPDRRIVDNAAEVRHLELLQPVRQHQCLVTRELDHDLAITHAHPYDSARPCPHKPTGLGP